MINLINKYFCDHKKKISDHKIMYLMFFRSNIFNLAFKKALIIWLTMCVPKQAFHRSLCRLERDLLLPELIYQT